MKKRMLKAIFFDLDDTLFSTKDFAKRARKNAISNMIRYGLKYPANQLYDDLLEVINEFNVNYDKHFDKLLLRIPRSSFDKTNYAILISAAIEGYHNTKFKYLNPFPDVVQFMKWLSKKTIVKGIVTAGLSIKQAEKIIRLGLYKYLTKEAIFITDQIGISKPNPKLFLHICKELRLKPNECMYVGNSVEKDIVPSKTAGFFTVLTDRNKQYTGLNADYVISSFSQLRQILQNDFILK